MTEKRGVVRRTEIVEEGDHLTRAKSLEGYKIAEAGDLVINIMLAWKRGLGVAWERGIVSPAYSVFKLRSAALNPRFLDYLVRSDEVVALMKSYSYGIVDSRLRIYPQTFLGLELPVPSQCEQQAIASFLDRETEKIDTLIEKKRRLLDLLEEKRIALITRAVTRGLDPDVPMKDSGVEWLGEIPEHWEVVKLRRIASVIDCKHRTPSYVPDGFPLVSTTEVKPGEIDLGVCTRFVSTDDFADMTEGPRLPRLGDIIYSRNASLGAAALVRTSQPFCMGQDVVLIRSREDTSFLTAQLNSRAVMSQVEAVGVGSTFSRINVATIRDLGIVLPPKEEQKVITGQLEIAREQMQAVAEKLTHAITLLQEYRTALISAAVTGTIDVRAKTAGPTSPEPLPAE